jgi:rhodanese-related sulfurtransferase
MTTRQAILLTLSFLVRRTAAFAPRHCHTAVTTPMATSWSRSSTAPPQWRLFSSQGPDIQHVNRAQMEEIVEQYEEGDSDYLVIDVRTPEEVMNTGKLGPNVHTLPVQVIMQRNVFALDEEDFEEICGFEKPTPDTTLVFSCAAGIRSVYACQYASQAGYTKLVNYMGGANEWFQPSRF